MRLIYVPLCLVMLCSSCCFGAVWLGVDVVNEENGLYGVCAGGSASDNPVDISDISMVEIRLPILWSSAPGEWGVWGPSYGMDGSDIGWQVDIGLWRESPASSYIRWTAPAGTSLPLPQSLTYHYFWFQVPSYLRADGRAEVLARDSSGSVGSDWTCGVPVFAPEPSSLVALTALLATMAGVAVRRGM